MTSGKSDLIDIAVEFRHATERAILVKDGDAEVWLPHSAIEIDGEERRGACITVTLSERLALEKELI